MRMLLIIFLSGSVTLLVIAVAVVSLHGFPFALMDSNEDGFVSPAEYLRSIDLGYRPVKEDESICTEVFLLKDGLPLRVVCEAS